MGSTAVYSGAARRKEDKESLNVLVCLIYPGIDQNFHTLLCHAGLNGLFRCGKRIFVTEEPLPWKLIFSAQHHMGNIFRDNAPTVSTSGSMHIDRKRLQKLRVKKIALGHKPDDHEEEQNMGGMTMGRW